MNKQYIIEARCQYRNKDGIDWSDWYVFDITPINEEDVKAKLKSLKEKVSVIDKKTKLKHEYREKDINQYKKEFDELVKAADKAEVEFAKIPRMKKPWLRKKKTVVKNKN